MSTRRRARAPWKTWSLRRQLLIGILVPTVLVVCFNTYSLHRKALVALNTAYDRTLLAAAKSISEELDVRGYDDMAELRATVPYSAQEAFETDNQSRLFYRVSNLRGEMISGYAELPIWRGEIPMRPPYASLVDFYDAHFRDQPVRVAVLLQPVASAEGRAMAVIQVAETLELREAAALQILWETIARQLVLVGVIAAIVVLVVQRATRPVRQLSHALQERAEDDLSPIHAESAPRELQPLVDATNDVMQRLSHLLEHQQRFVRDASHQLRTPLAVLKVQVQSALRDDLPHREALLGIGETVDRATQLANQMLALAKVEQLRQQNQPTRVYWDDVLRDVALDVSPLIAQSDLDFGIQTRSAPVLAHEWMLRELCRNLLHNAIRHTPVHGTLNVSLQVTEDEALLTISDSGSGIDDELASRLFQAFSAGDVRAGSGLGLAICQQIVRALDGQIQLRNREDALGKVIGLDAMVQLPLAS